ncbi:MAG: hypothetical protein NT116_00740 [Candidatus Parcubacteria bacterium]|nr:hypothetical protein [Candidatus Parcubacteria bacterium]
MITKLQELITLLKAKKGEQQIAIKQLLKFFVAISNELDTIGKDSNKLTINQDRFNQMIDESLDVKIIDKYEFLLKESV